MKAIINPKNKPVKLTFKVCFVVANSNISSTIDKSIIGILKINENFAHSFLSYPEIKPALIVVPERDIPGKTAKPCAMPIMIAAFNENSFVFLFFEIISTKNKIIAEIKKHIKRYFPENDSFTIGSKTRIINAVKIVDKQSCIILLEKGCKTKYFISFQKTITTARSVAKCKTILINKESSTLNIFDKSTRCPLEEIGRNSHNP